LAGTGRPVFCSRTLPSVAWQERRSHRGPLRQRLAVPPSAGHLRGDLSPELFAATEFVVITACACHDAQSAFRWGMASMPVEPDCARDCYVAVESLRNSTMTLHLYAPHWVVLRAVPVAAQDPMELEDRRWLWTALCVEFEAVEVLTERLQLRFVHGQLLLCEDFMAADELWVEQVVDALSHIWQFQKWSESRFLALGASARSLVAAMLCGLDDFHAWLLTQDVSLFYLRGYGRLEADRREYIAAACFISRVPDAALSELLEDGRVPMKFNELVSACCEELRWLRLLPDHVWESVARVVGTPRCTGSWLRDRALAGSHTAWHFFHRRVLAAACELPWSLVRSRDREEALRELAEDNEQPQEPVAAQLWLLARHGYPTGQLLQVLELLSQISWSTIITEQQHGSLAAIHRHHPDYGMRTLATRATLLQLRKLLPAFSADERRLELLKQRISKTLRAVPERMSARNLYVADLLKVARNREWTMAGRPAPKRLAQHVVKHHVKTWALKSLDAQRDYAKRLDLARSERREHLAQELEALRAERDLLLQRLGSAGQDVSAPSMAAAGFTSEDLEHFNALVQSNWLSGVRLEDRRRARIEAPEPLAQAVVAAHAAAEGGAVGAGAAPAWAAVACRHEPSSATPRWWWRLTLARMSSSSSCTFAAALLHWGPQTERLKPLGRRCQRLLASPTAFQLYSPRFEVAGGSSAAFGDWGQATNVPSESPRLPGLPVGALERALRALL
jgi:hypothetical protein